MAKTIDTNKLTPGKLIRIRGNVAYSRLAKQIAGNELAEDMERKRKAGRIPIDRPYTTITICNATILTEGPQPTLEEQYIEERLYKSSMERSQGYSFTINDKGKYLPVVAELDNNNTANQVKMAKELASGLDVTLVLRVFKGSPNNGVALHMVLVNEPVKFYDGGVGAGLEALGITFNPISDEVEYKDGNEPPVTPVEPPSANGNPYSNANAAPYTTPYDNANASGYQCSSDNYYMPHQNGGGIKYNSEG